MRRSAATITLITWVLASCGIRASDENHAAATTVADARPVVSTIHHPAVAAEPAQRIKLKRTLVFTATAGFRHASISNGVAALEDLGRVHGFEVVHTESREMFTDDHLADVDVVVFLNTTGDVLDTAAEAALERYVRSGGGWVGIHAAADTEYDWPFYGELLGDEAWFRNHPPGTSPATLIVSPDEAGHYAVRHLPPTFVWEDEWYAFRNRPGPSVDVLLRLDESSYDAADASMGDDHPISWSHRVDLGHAWYTGVGHRPDIFDDEAYQLHVLGGLMWAAGLR